MAGTIARTHLEHFYRGKLYQQGVPAGDFRVTCWSPGLAEHEAEVLFARASIGSYNNVRSVDSLRHGYALIDLPPGHLLLLHARRSPLRTRGYFYPEYHVIILPRYIWEQMEGNLQGLVDLLEPEDQAPQFPSPGPLLPLIEWTPPGALSREERKASVQPFEGQGMLEALETEVLKRHTIAITHAPGVAARLRLLQALLARLPAHERTALAFATEVFDSAACGARLKFLFADPLAQPAPGDTVIRWRPDRDASFAEQIESEYILYLRENAESPEALVKAVDEIDVAYQGVSTEESTSGDQLDALALKLRPQRLKYPERWVGGIGLYGSSKEFRTELANPELQRLWPEPMRNIARYLTGSGAPRPPAGELVRAAISVTPNRPQFLLALARTAVAGKRLDLFDKETLDRLAGIGHRDAHSRAEVIAILSGVRHAEWIEALEPWDVWDLLNLRLELRDFAGAADLLRSMHGKWKGSGAWAEDLQAFWLKGAALNTPDDACFLALQMQSTDLPSYMLFDLLIVSLKKYNWNALELVRALSKIYSEQNLPADRTEALLDLVVGLLPYNADPLVNQVVIKALKRLIDKPEGRELNRRLGKTPHREGLYVAVMRVARAMDIKTLEGFYKLLSYDRIMARESAGVRSLLIAAGRIKRGGPMGFLQRLAPRKRL